jgi:pimeloyl-ACP methyl ester carboxylesterase
MRHRLISLLVMLCCGACGARPAPPTTPASAPRAGFDADLTGYTYPFEVRYHTFEAQRQALRMAYMDVAPPRPNGQTVVLLHGKNFSGAYWEQTIRALHDRGFRVVVPDQIGFGKSSKPEHFQFSFQALAAHTTALLDALRVDQYVLVGHSMGGMLATRLAVQYPARVARLVLVNPIGLEDWSRVVPYATVDAAYARELAQTRDMIREYMRTSYFDGQWKVEYEPLVALGAGWAEGPDRERIAWVSALTYDMIVTQPVVHDFPRIEAPTLLIIGTRDRTALGKQSVPPEVAATLGHYEVLGKQTAAAIAGARLVELEGVGHLPQVEAFDPYLRALDAFLGVPAREGAP